MRRVAIGCIPAAVFLCTRLLSAHGFQPTFADLDDIGHGRYAVTWRTALEPDATGEDARFELPARCLALESPRLVPDGNGESLRWTVDCGASGLAGGRIGVTFSTDAAHAVILRVRLAGTAPRLVELTRARPAVRLPSAPDAVPRVDAADTADTSRTPSWPALAALCTTLALVSVSPRSRRRTALARTAPLAAFAFVAPLAPVPHPLRDVWAAWLVVVLAASLARVPVRAVRGGAFVRVLATALGCGATAYAIDRVLALVHT